MKTNDPRCFRMERAYTRREFLERSGAGFGALALSYLLGGNAARGAATSPLAAKPPQLPPHA